MANRVEAVVWDLAGPTIEALGLELVDVQYHKQGGQWHLLLSIDREGGVTLDDCVAVSRAVEARLDETDPIPTSYHLEVSSPGVERELKRDADFVRFTGRQVRVRTFAPVAGQRNFVGELVGFVDGSLQLRLAGNGKSPGQEIAIPRDQVAKANLHVEF